MRKKPKLQITPDDPVHRLHQLLERDMRAVDETIIASLDSDVALITQVAKYLVNAGGKRLRPLLTLASAQLCGYDGSGHINLAASIEFIHTATLLHDDVVDESDRRRGQESANLVFGNSPSVLVGDFLFSRSFRLMVDVESLEVLKILSQASVVISEGEVMQLTTNNDVSTSRDRYLNVISAKTAALFAAACEVAPVIAAAPNELRDAMAAYGHNLGIAFQIADDVLDYSGAQERLGKTVGDDFREGKVTLPVILAMEGADNAQADFWQRTIGDGAINMTDFDTAQSYLTDQGHLKQAMDIAGEYVERAKHSIELFDDGRVRRALHDLADFVIMREY
jgi:octaprenyl-diphosphate synthase